MEPRPARPAAMLGAALAFLISAAGPAPASDLGEFVSIRLSPVQVPPSSAVRTILPAFEAGPAWRVAGRAGLGATAAAPRGAALGAALGAGVEDFARRAEQLFHAGRLAPGRHGAVVYAAPRPGIAEAPSDEELRRRVARSPLTNAEREQVVAELLRAAGASASEVIRQDAGRGRSNIYVVKKGRRGAAGRIVVLGGHHDKVETAGGAGTIDNWTGATLVANVFQALRDVDLDSTFIFVAFAREEEGLVGSKVFVEGLPPEDRKRVAGMVNLDTLAVDGTYSWKNNSTKSLLELARQVADRERLQLSEVSFWGGDADSSSFRRAGMPAATVFGASPGVIFDIIHSERDTMAVFSMPHYKNAFLLTTAVISALDGK